MFDVFGEWPALPLPFNLADPLPSAGVTCHVCGSTQNVRSVEGRYLLCSACRRLRYNRLAFMRGVLGGPSDGASKWEKVTHL